MNAKVRYWIKQVLGAVHLKQHPFKKPILLISTRRSGSTLLLEMVHTQPGVTYSDQPLDQWHYKPKGQQLAPQLYSQFIHLDQSDEEKVIQYLNEILQGQVRMYAPWRWLDANYSWQVDRVVAKILNAHGMIKTFAQKLDAHIIYLIRHPLPTALSIANLNWGSVGEAFLNNEWYCKHFLTSNQFETGKEIMTTGSKLEQLVLEWSLSNLAPLQYVKKGNGLVITYEELILRPYRVAKLIADYCELPYPQVMAAQIQRASRNTAANNQAILLRENTISLLSRWQNKIPLLKAQKMMNIVENFIPTVPYRSDSIFPTPNYCHFGTLNE